MPAAGSRQCGWHAEGTVAPHARFPTWRGASAAVLVGFQLLVGRRDAEIALNVKLRRDSAFLLFVAHCNLHYIALHCICPASSHHITWGELVGRAVRAESWA